MTVSDDSDKILGVVINKTKTDLSGSLTMTVVVDVTKSLPVN